LDESEPARASQSPNIGPSASVDPMWQNVVFGIDDIFQERQEKAAMDRLQKSVQEARRRGLARKEQLDCGEESPLPSYYLTILPSESYNIPLQEPKANAARTSLLGDKVPNWPTKDVHQSAPASSQLKYEKRDNQYLDVSIEARFKKHAEELASQSGRVSDESQFLQQAEELARKRVQISNVLDEMSARKSSKESVRSLDSILEECEEIQVKQGPRRSPAILEAKSEEKDRTERKSEDRSPASGSVPVDEQYLVRKRLSKPELESVQAAPFFLVIGNICYRCLCICPLHTTSARTTSARARSTVGSSTI